MQAINYVFFYITTILSILALLIGAFQLIRHRKRLKKSYTQSDSWIFFLPYKVCLALLLLVALFVRIFHLGSLPAGINCDEAGMAYDAWCLANFGTDRFGYPFPVYLVNYSGGQSALYAYLCSILIKIFGYSIVVARIPAVLGGMMTVLFGTLTTKELYGKRASLITGILLTVCPVFITMSRKGFDCNLLLAFSTAALYMLLIAIKTKKNLLFVGTGILFGLCLYCYSLSWIVIPVFLILTGIYLICFRKITLKNTVSFCIPLFLLALPLMAFVYINTFEKAEIVTSLFSIPNLLYYRTGEIKLENMAHIGEAIKVLLTKENFRFFSFDNYYTLYTLSIPLVLLGFFLVIAQCIKSTAQKTFKPYMLLLLFFISSIISTGIASEPSVYRSNCIYFVFVFFITTAILFICKTLHFYRFVLCFILSLYAFCTCLFAKFYFSNEINERYPIVWFDFNYTTEIYEYFHQNNITTEIYFDEYNVTTYCVAMLEYQVSPKEFMAEGNTTASDYVHYQNMNFYLPSKEHIAEDAIYIVLNYNNGYLDYLNQMNFWKKEYGYYTIFYPIE